MFPYMEKNKKPKVTDLKGETDTSGIIEGFKTQIWIVNRTTR